MNSMATGRYRSANATNSGGGYREPSTIITPIPNHKDGHYVRPNRVALKYPNFKKNVDPNAHVRVFNFAIKKIPKTFEKYIINVTNYTLRDITLD